MKNEKVWVFKCVNKKCNHLNVYENSPEASETIVRQCPKCGYQSMAEQLTLWQVTK